MTSQPNPLLLDVSAASERLSIGETITKRLIADGKLESVKIGRRRLVPVAALEKFVAELADSAS